MSREEGTLSECVLDDLHSSAIYEEETFATTLNTIIQAANRVNSKHWISICLASNKTDN